MATSASVTTPTQRSESGERMTTGEGSGGAGRGLPRALVLVLALCLLAAGAQALMVPEDPASLAGGADGIVLGTVTSVESRWTADRTIETTARIALDATVKGTFPGRAVTVTVQGGTVDGVTQVVEDEPVLRAGRTGGSISSTGKARPGSGSTGPGRASSRSSTTRSGWPTAAGARRRSPRRPTAPASPRSRRGRRCRRSRAPSAATSGGPVIASVSPSSASAGTGTTITITGSGSARRPPGSREPTSGSSTGARRRRRSSRSSRRDGRTSTTTSTRSSRGPTPGSWSACPTGTMSDGYDGSASSGKVWVVTDAGASSAASPFGVTFGYGGIKWASAPTFVVNGNCPGVRRRGRRRRRRRGRPGTRPFRARPSGSSNGGTTTSTAYRAATGRTSSAGGPRATSRARAPSRSRPGGTPGPPSSSATSGSTPASRGRPGPPRGAPTASRRSCSTSSATGSTSATSTATSRGCRPTTAG